MKKKNVWRWKESQLARQVVRGKSSDSISELADHEVHSDVIVTCRTPQYNVFSPSITRLHNGELIVIYHSSPRHIGWGRIACTRSKGGGNTWSPPEVIIDTPYSDGGHITELSDGSLMLTHIRQDISKDPLENYTYVWRSFDYGHTWRDPALVSSIPCAGFGNVLELPDGRLLLAVYRPRDPSRKHDGVKKEDYLRYLAEVAEGKEKRSAEEVFKPAENPCISILMASEDGGKTWHQEGIIAEEIDGKAIGFNETALAYLGDDHVVAVMRTDAPFANACIAHSEDGGKSFGEPRMLNTNAHAPNLLVIDENRVLLTYGACDYTGGYVTRYVMAMLGDARKDFEGATEKIIYTGSGGDASYPHAVRMGPDEVFVVYYDAGVGIIGGRFLKLSDLA